MIRDDIIRMARESNLMSVKFSTALEEMWVGQLERFANLVAAAERDKWEPVIAAVIRELPERMRGDKGNAPGHAHEIAGIWDSDNGDIAGTKCAWCAAWNTALEVIRARGQHD